MSVDALLLHPVFWHQKKVQAFLCDLSNKLISTKTKSEQNLKTQFNNLISSVVPTVSDDGGGDVDRFDWMDTLDQDVKVYISNKMHKNKPLYKGGELFSLLRAVRNISGHLFQIYGEKAKQYFGSEVGKILLKEKLSSYFGDAIEDCVAYWLHKFPKLLPVCYVFAQNNKLLGSEYRNQYYLKEADHSKFNMRSHSSYVGIFNELYIRITNDSQFDKFLGEYKVKDTHKIKIFKIHPWVLGNHDVIMFKFSNGNVTLLKDESQSERKSDPNYIIEASNANQCRGMDCTCKEAWKSAIIKLQSIDLTHENLLVVLCEKIETGLLNAYINGNEDVQCVVIFTKDNYIRVRESVKKFENEAESKKRKLKFLERKINWSDLAEHFQNKNLFEHKVNLQNHKVSLQTLFKLSKTQFFNDMDSDFLLNLIHWRDVGLPEVVKDFASLASGTIGLARILEPNHSLSLSYPTSIAPASGLPTHSLYSLHSADTSLHSPSKTQSNSSALDFTHEPACHLNDTQDIETEEKEYVHEDDFLGATAHRIIIAPIGMGKSTMLKRITKKMIDKHSNSTPILTIFVEFTEVIQALDHRTPTKDELVEVIAAAITQSQFCKKLLIPVVSGEGAYKIFLMLDALDDVAEHLQWKCTDVLTIIRNELPHITLFATTRPENSEKLESVLGRVSYKLKELDNSNSDLANILGKHVHTRRSAGLNQDCAVDEESLIAIAKKYIDKNSSIFRIPFWLSMLAEICMKLEPQHEPQLEHVEGKRFANLQLFVNEAIASTMTTVYSKTVHNGEVIQASKLSVLYNKENKQFLAVHNHKDQQIPGFFQMNLG